MLALLRNMREQCVVPHCRTGDVLWRKRLSPNVTFHKFPSSPGLKSEWNESIFGKKSKGRRTAKDAVVCSLHFTPDSFQKKRGRGRPPKTETPDKDPGPLKDDAVPSIFPAPVLAKITGATPRAPPEEALKCAHCTTYWTQDENELAAHINAIHLGYFPAGCGHCLDKGIPCWVATEAKLQQHTENKHPDLSINLRPNIDSQKEDRLTELIRECLPEGDREPPEVEEETTMKREQVKRGRKKGEDKMIRVVPTPVTEGPTVIRSNYPIRFAKRRKTIGSLPPAEPTEPSPELLEEPRHIIARAKKTLKPPPKTPEKKSPPKLDNFASEETVQEKEFLEPDAEQLDVAFDEVFSPVRLSASLARPRLGDKLPARWSLSALRQAEQEGKEITETPTKVVTMNEETESVETIEEGGAQTDGDPDAQERPRPQARPDVREMPRHRARFSLSYVEEHGMQPETEDGQEEDNLMSPDGPKFVFVPPMPEDDKMGTYKSYRPKPYKQPGKKFLSEQPVKKRAPRDPDAPPARRGRPPNPNKPPKKPKLDLPRTELVFECGHCGLKMARTKEHVMSQHMSTAMFSCQYCEFQNGHMKSMKRHLWTQHPDQPFVYIDHESDELIEELIQKHIQYFAFDYRNAKFVCQMCGHYAPFGNGMFNHAVYNHPHARKCGYCGVVFADSNGLSLHQAQLHAEQQKCYRFPLQVELYNACFPADSQPTTLEHEPPPTCRINVDCLKCNSRVSTEASTEHARGHMPNASKYACPYCGETNTKCKALKNHMRRKHPRRPQNVITPGKGIKNENREIVLECFGFNKVECDFCHFAPSFRNVRRHIGQHLEELGQECSFEEMARRCFEKVLAITMH